MNELFEKLKDWLNIETLPLIGLLIFTGMFILLPSATLSELGVLKFHEDNQTYLGFGFVFSIALLIAKGIYGIWDVCLKHLLKDLAQVYFYKKEAHTLTEEEKEILRKFIVNRTGSVNLSIHNGVVLGLEQKHFIYRAGLIGIGGANGLSFPFNIQPWAWKHLNKKPELLKLMGGTE